MERKAVYRKKYHIEISDVDFNKQLKLSTLFSHFQDVASDAVDNLGIGINDLEKNYGVAWILIRMRVEVIRHPVWNEEITIETWPQEPKTLDFERDFLVYDSEGNIIIRAISTWIIFDIKTRRIKKSSVINTNYPEIITKRAIDCKLGKLNPYNELQIAYKKMIGYSDIDFNGHLNNSKYIDFITDCFTFENHQMYQMKSLEVNFIHEALPGDFVTLYKDVSEVNHQMIYIEGVNETENKSVFKAKVEIRLR
ncbi:acyl-ACP thioesterase [Mycoplasmatota bacterium]|nr:acyl-ACP thioesterase [Mycoplasmatota bacterium]